MNKLGEMVLELSKAVIQIQFDSPDLVECLKPYLSEGTREKYDGRVSIQRGIPPIRNNAIRSFFHEDAGEVYAVDSIHDYRRKGMSVSIDHGNSEVVVCYEKQASDLLWFFLQAVRSLYNSICLKKGITFMLGHAIELNKKSYLITGAPECGKYASLQAFKNLSASLLSRNLLVDCESKVILPYELGMAEVRTDMPLDSELYLEPEFPKAEYQDSNQLSGVITVATWNSEESELSKVPASIIVNCMQAINEKYYSLYTNKQLSKMKDSYTALFEGIDTFMFLRGTSKEKELACLRSFSKDYEI